MITKYGNTLSAVTALLRIIGQENMTFSCAPATRIQSAIIGPVNAPDGYTADDISVTTGDMHAGFVRAYFSNTGGCAGADITPTDCGFTFRNNT